MRLSTMILPVLLLLLASPSAALEKVAHPMDRDPDGAADDWLASGATCTISYANTCTGWLWVWDDWAPGETFGVVFHPCCPGGGLAATQAYFWTGAPAGYGYTGTLALSALGPNDCPGIAYGAQPLLPPDGPEVTFWGVPVPNGPVVLTYTNGSRPADYAIPTDHPAAGATGPQSCGLCFPSTRTIHTFRYGTPASPLCPGSPLNDGVCDVEALLWSAAFWCYNDGPVGVEPSTWATIKNLYR